MVPFFNQHHILLLSKHANNLKDICLFRLYRKIESLLNECIITIEVNTVKITQKCSKRKHSFLSEDMSMPSNISSILIDYDSLTKARLLVDQLKNYAWETLHSTHWRSIPIPARDIYALATYLHTSLTLALNNITRIKSINDEDNQINSKTINQMVIELDKALLLGGPLMRNDLQYLLHHLTSTYASILYRPLIFNPSTNSRSSNTSDNNSSSGNNNDINIYDGSNLKGKLRRCCPRGPGKRREIPIINNPDLHVFLTQYMESDTPAVLRDCSDENEWPALSRWSDLEYFNKGTLINLVIFLMLMFYYGIILNYSAQYIM